MTRNLKALGLALVAVFAMSALMAGTASAEEFHSEAETTKISGAQTTTHVFKTTAGELTCENASFAGTQTTKTSKSVTVTPTYTGCHIIIFGSTIGMTVNTNGCQYTLTTGYHTSITPTVFTQPETHNTCPAGKKIQITGAGCTVEVGAQTIGGISYKTNGSHVDVTANSTGISYNHSGFTCGTGSGTNGTYTGTVTTKGTNTAGEAVKIWVE